MYELLVSIKMARATFKNDSTKSDEMRLRAHVPRTPRSGIPLLGTHRGRAGVRAPEGTLADGGWDTVKTIKDGWINRRAVFTQRNATPSLKRMPRTHARPERSLKNATLRAAGGCGLHGTIAVARELTHGDSRTQTHEAEV